VRCVAAWRELHRAAHARHDVRLFARPKS
jgi:hypothetical protein